MRVRPAMRPSPDAYDPCTTTAPSDENRQISCPSRDGGSGNTNSRASIAPKTSATDPKFQSVALFSNLLSIRFALRKFPKIRSVSQRRYELWRARHCVGPWIPVMPVDLIPALAGSDRSANVDYQDAHANGNAEIARLVRTRFAVTNDASRPSRAKMSRIG